MFDLFSRILVEHPELALFLALGLGYAIGKIRYGTFTLGAVTGCLIAGVMIGQTGVVMSNDVKQAFFLLFLFAIGYRTGPQFFRSLNAKALPQIAVTVILCVVALGVVLGASLVFNLGIGTASGLLAGATTESAAVGVALDTFRNTGADDTMVRAFEADVATSFAVAYLAGVIATIFMTSQIAPRFLRRSLAEACAELEASMNASEDGESSAQSARRSIEARAYLIDPTWVGMTISQAEARVPQGRESLCRAGPPQGRYPARRGRSAPGSGRHCRRGWPARVSCRQIRRNRDGGRRYSTSGCSR